MDRRLKEKIIQKVRNTILANFNLRGGLDFYVNDIEKVQRENYWINRSLAFTNDNGALATSCLQDFLNWRRIFDVKQCIQGINFEDYKKLVRIQGKDKSGAHLLILNLSEIETFVKMSGNGDLVFKLIMGLLENLLDSKDENTISMVFYHGLNKCMETLPDCFAAYIEKIFLPYQLFIPTIYVFEDVISHECRKKLRHFEASRSLEYVNQSNVSKYFIDFDIESYENENLRYDEAKLQKNTKKQDSAKLSKAKSEEKVNVVTEDSVKENTTSAKVLTNDENSKDKKEKKQSTFKETTKDSVLKKLYDMQKELDDLIKMVEEI